MRAALLPLALLLAASPGCYLTHVAGGQLSILWGRQPIAELLADPALPAERRARLELVLEVRRFAIEELGLNDSDSYTEVYDTGGGPIAWNVSAAYRDALVPYRWWFPIVGSLPYMGFFDPDLALEEARDLSAEGLDVVVLPVPAYSTLGWFDDPIFTGVLDGSEANLVEVVIHKLAHATVWVDQDAQLNENLAQFVGEKGAEAFFLARGGPDDPALVRARHEAEDSARFNAAMDELRDELERLYAASGSRERKLELREEAFARFRERFARDVQPLLHGQGYDGFATRPLNNAWVLAFRRYHGEREAFEALFARLGET